MSKLGKALLIGFVLFELSRAVAIGEFLLPIWEHQANAIANIASKPLWIAIPTLAIMALAFVIPMAGVVWGLLAVRRRLSRKGTALTSGN